MEGSEKVSDVLTDGTPSMFEEERAEPIGPRACVGVHLPEGWSNFLVLKLFFQLG
jgi:hypothetical protein